MPAPERPRRPRAAARHRALLLVAYGALAVVALAIAGRGSLALVGSTFPGFVVWDNGTIASFHAAGWTGPQAGIGRGRVTSIDGEPFRGISHLLRHASGTTPGTPVRYEVLRDGERQVRVVPTMSFSALDGLSTFGNYLLGSAALLAIGALALALGAEQAAGRGLALAAGAAGLLLALVVDYLTAARGVVACQLVEALCPAALANLALVFPVERVTPRTRRRAIGVLAVLLLLHGMATAWLFRTRPEAALALVLSTYLALTLALLGFAASLTHALFRAGDPRTRLQAAVVAAGALPAVLFLTIPTLGFSLLGWDVSSTWSTLALPLIPLSILYAIVRLDLLEAERFVRLGVGYGVATAAVVLAWIACVALLERLVLPDAGSRPATQFLLLIGIALSFEPVRRSAQAWVSRAFFRFEADVGAVLEASSAELARLSDEGRIRAAVARRVAGALGLESAEVADGSAGAPLEVPVVFGDQPLAVLRCGPKRSGAPFSDAERELVRGVAGQAALAIHNARTLQALRAAQEENLRTERMATIGEFARAVAHGIRNPLSSIRASAQGAGERASGEELRLIVRESDRIDQRIRSLLEFSRAREARPRPTDLRALLDGVADAVASQAARAGVELSIEAGAPLVADVDSDVLSEALLELCANALAAMDTGSGKLVLGLAAQGPGAVLRVRDSGKGIPAAIQPRIFDLFFTNRAEGTGLGLATVRKLAQMLGGRVELAHSGSDGSEFCLHLPLARPAQSGSSAAPS